MSRLFSKTRRLIRRMLLFPLSPRPFSSLICVLRFLRFLPHPGKGRSGDINGIFVSHPYSSVGDMVLLLPLLERIKDEWPDAHIDIAAGSGACDLLGGVDYIRNRFVCGSHRTRVPILGDYGKILRYLSLYRREIRSFRYDLAVAPRWGSILRSDAVYLAYLTGAQVRIGYSSSVDGGDPAMDRLLTLAAAGGRQEHETTRNLKLLDRAGMIGRGPGFVPAVGRPIQAVVDLARRTPLRQTERVEFPFLSTAQPRYGVVSPGTTNPYNAWPVDRLSEVVRTLHDLRGLHFLIVGGPADSLICEELAACAPGYVSSIAGRTDLRQVARILSGAVIFIGMDSGIAHISGALGLPTLVLSPFPSTCRDEHPGSPIRFRPCGPRVSVLQPETTLPPCSGTCTFPGPHCIKQIGVADVLRAAQGLVDDAGA